MEGHITHTAITSYGYGTLRLKEGPNQPGHIFSTLFIYFIPFFSLINYSLRDPITYAPEFFATPFHDSTRDSHSRPMFTTPLATPIRDSRSRLHSRLPFATHVRDSTRDSRSRLPFHDSNRNSHSRLTVFMTSPSSDSTTDGWTVSTPQRCLPSVPTLTLTNFF